MSAPRRFRREGRVVGVVAVGLLAAALAGCGTDTAAAPGGPPSTSPTASTGVAPSPSAAVTQPVTASVDWGHVHNLLLDGDRLLLGTHEGLWEQQPGQPPVLLSEQPFDVMGLASDGQGLLASGHPGAGEALPADLGLMRSADGRQWQQVSLLGEVDFHRLVASGSIVVGLSAHDGALLRSQDAGASWANLGTPPLYDVAVDPAAPSRLVGTTRQGPVASTDGGTTFTGLDGAPLLALLAWTGPMLYGVAPDGTVHASTDGGSSWTTAGGVGGPPEAVASDGSRVVVLVAGTVLESTDGGRSFTPRLVVLTT